MQFQIIFSKIKNPTKTTVLYIVVQQQANAAKASCVVSIESGERKIQTESPILLLISMTETEKLIAMNF